MGAETVALAHAPEGAGNATRMMAVAAELEARGREVAVAGGGPGAMFLSLNGYDEFEPPTVEFIDRRQASVLDALARAGPRAARRLRAFWTWIGDVDPAVLLTDDPFAAAAATARRIPFFRLDHSLSADFSATVERTGFRLFNGYSLRAAEGFFYTCLWPDDAPVGLHGVGPIAHEPADPTSVDPFDALVVPGTYSTGFDRLADRLREAGHSVRLVGGPDWEAVPSMVPYAAAADVVVCTGFSSIAEAAVAGTPCVVYPFIDCQRGVAARIAARDVPGITVVHTLAAAEAAALDPGESPVAENGAVAVADALVAWLDGP
jgi:hypothetical protein